MFLSVVSLGLVLWFLCFLNFPPIFLLLKLFLNRLFYFVAVSFVAFLPRFIFCSFFNFFPCLCFSLYLIPFLPALLIFVFNI